MNFLKKVFPNAFKAKDIGGLIVALLVYVLIDVVCGFVIGLLASIPLIGIIFSLLGTIVGVYALVGIVLSILVFVKLLK